MYIYDVLLDEFSSGTPMPSGRSRGAGGVAVHDGLIYYAGGLNGGEAVDWFDSYDPESDTWAQLPPMPRPRDHFHAVVVDGEFYAIGGRDSTIEATMPEVDVYDIAAGEWTTLDTSIPTERGGFAAAVLGSRIVIIGGESAGQAHDEVEIYDPTTNTWTTADPMPTARHGIQAAVCNGTIYIAGGGDEPGDSPVNAHEALSFGGPPTECPNPISSAEEYVWEELPPDPFARAEAQGLSVGTKLYVFGGFDTEWAGYCTTKRSDVFDLKSNTWSPVPNPLPDYYTHAGLAVDGPLIHMAGSRLQPDRVSEDDDSCNREVELGTQEIWTFDTRNQTWSNYLPDLPAERSAGGFARVGRTLYYFSGTDEFTENESDDHWALDLEDPEAGWQPRAPLPNGRNHVGVAVVDGKVYAVGGQHGTAQGNTPQDDVHRYDPTTDTWTQLADLPQPMSHVVATIEVAGRVFVLGGENGHDNELADVFAYDPHTDEWTSITPLPLWGRSGIAAERNGVITYARGEFGRQVYRGVPVVDWD